MIPAFPLELRDLEMNTWAIRSFRDVADADYIAARLACRARLPVQFLWACQQAFEKYLKCILFLHRIGGKNVKHDLRAGLKLLEDAGIDLELNAGSREFIEAIADVGEYRYMESSFTIDWQRIVLLELDRAVWELRRFATLDSRARAQKLIEGIPTIRAF
jgi:hypothetical protein